MIYTVGKLSHIPDSPEHYTRSDFMGFLNWWKLQEEYELDVETTVTDNWCDKELITVQFGATDGSDQWVLHYPSLTDLGKSKLKEVLEVDVKKKLIHNGLFEYVVLKFHGIEINNIYDTMLAEQCIYGGITSDGIGEPLYSLRSLCLKYLQIELDKTYQTSFNYEPLIPEQVVYAADDVRYLSTLRELQKPLIEADNLWEVCNLEFEALCGYGDMTYNGIELNPHDWLQNLELVEPLLQEGHQKLEAMVFEVPQLYNQAIKLDFLSEQDRLTINWKSANQKKQLLSWVAPHLELVTKAYLQKYLKKRPILDEVDELLYELIEGNEYPLVQHLKKNFRDSLIEHGYLIPAGRLTINWNSVQQVLPLIQTVEPKLKAMDEESMSKTTHPIIPLIQDYKDTLKLKSTYGEAFIEKHLEPDGKIRTSFNQIVSTGRVSSSKPNMQNIPAKESVGNRYRNAFSCPSDWVYVDSDYAGQELVIIAYLSKDPVWTEALEKGQDLHSVCAELVYGDKWKQGAEEGCTYYAFLPGTREHTKGKCSCKKHKTMRSGVKSINFGLAYGMSEYKLSGELRIPLAAAKKLIEDYFRTFPKIGTVLNYFGKFGVTKGYIQTIWPFFRKRYYPEWKYVPEYAHEAHLEKIQYHKTLGSIERASKNHPIQGTAADITKYSLVLIRRFLKTNNLTDTIKLVIQVHDQNTTICKREMAEWWRDKMTTLMEEAAYYVIPNGLLKAETNITERWSK